MRIPDFASVLVPEVKRKTREDRLEHSFRIERHAVHGKTKDTKSGQHEHGSVLLTKASFFTQLAL